MNAQEQQKWEEQFHLANQAVEAMLDAIDGTSVIDFIGTALRAKKATEAHPAKGSSMMLLALAAAIIRLKEQQQQKEPQNN